MNSGRTGTTDTVGQSTKLMPLTNDMLQPSFNLRPAGRGDIPQLAALGVALAAQHGSYDPLRFVVTGDPLQTFAEFFTGELANPDAAIVVAEDESTILGYAFARLEPASLVDLMDSAYWLHDLYLLPGARGRGCGKALVHSIGEIVRARGGRKLLLSVSPKNTVATRTFQTLGFRPTMVEMQLDLSAHPSPGEHENEKT
jgi:ribosomal protein S18 acetylase RimI-like enzyme